MCWSVEYYSDRVLRKINDMPCGFRLDYSEIMEVMRECGPNLGIPLTRAMGDKLFELRLKSKEGIARVFYCVAIKKRIVILHSFIKKTQKTPLKELVLAIPLTIHFAIF